MQASITWDGHESHIVSGSYRFITDEKPKLSFIFKALYYEPDAGNCFAVTPEGESRTLFDIEIEECKEYAEQWYIKHDYPVQCYVEPYCLYEGEFSKSEAEARGFKYTVNEHPDHPASKWTGDTWERLAMVVLDNETIMEYPDSICEHCVAGFTANELQEIPVRPTVYYGWDLKNWCWKDSRSLMQAKIDALTSIRADFELVRYAKTSDRYFTPNYETQNWVWQVQEAKEWLKDNTVETPYIDTFLGYRTDEHKPSKQELCENILDNHKAFLIAMAKVNADQWSWLSKVKAATDNDTCVRLADEAHEYCVAIRNDIEGAL